MKTFATSRENTTLKVDDEAISMIWKDYTIWEAKAQHIKKVLFKGCDQTMVVEVSAHGEELDHLIELPRDSYDEAEMLFTENLDGVQVSSLSKRRQLILPFVLMACVLMLTIILVLISIEINTAPAVENAEKPGMFRAFCTYLTSQFGTLGILLGGFLVLLIPALVALKRYFFPKKASTVLFHYGDRMMIFSGEEDQDESSLL